MHVAEATRIAGTDLQPLTVLCKPAPASQPSHEEVDQSVGAQIARPAPESGGAFENIYFVGAAWVSAWALKTSEGIILIDALNNTQEAATLIEGGMRKVGLDPKDIKYIIVTHAHGDHYGGVNYLGDRYRSRVVMSESDWKMAETALEFESSHCGPVPRRDISVKDGDVIVLGDTKGLMFLTPGHTMGTQGYSTLLSNPRISPRAESSSPERKRHDEPRSGRNRGEIRSVEQPWPVFDVKSEGQTHRAMIWGGTSFNFGKDIPGSTATSVRHSA